MKHVYLIPAPDMDERAIEAVQLENVTFIPVALPKLTIDSNLQGVTKKIAEQIKHADPILLGFCYGAVLAIELGKQVAAEKIIVVSGIRNSQDIVFSRKILAFIFYVIPESILCVFGQLASFLINSMLRLNVKIPRLWLNVGQNKFIVKHVLNFNSRELNGEIIRIHGSRDRIVPLADSDADYEIKGAGHFMFVHRRKDVLRAIAQALG